MLTHPARAADDEGEGPIRPQKAICDVRQVLGPSDILLSDVGAHKMWIARHYHCHEPVCLRSLQFVTPAVLFPPANFCAVFATWTAEHLSDPEWLLLDGIRTARRHLCRADLTARPQGACSLSPALPSMREMQSLPLCRSTRNGRR